MHHIAPISNKETHCHISALDKRICVFTEKIKEREEK
jgi:hypothetical protein